MDDRFSTLFLSPPPPILRSDKTMSGALPDPKTIGKKHKSSMKHILRKLFGIPKQKPDPLIKDKSAESRPSELSQQVWTEFTSVLKGGNEQKTEKTKSTGLLKSFASNDNSTVVVPAPDRTAQGTRRKDAYSKSNWSTTASITTKKRSSTNSTRDSKFSSISSLPSVAALSFHTHPHTSSNGPSISLSVQELAALQSLIRRVERQLKKQEYLTTHLAGNLVHLLGKKEMQIQCMRRCKVQDREKAAREIFRAKENVGRGFLRRGVLVGRCEGALTLLRTALDNATRAPSTPRRNRRSSQASGSNSRTSSPSSYTTATSTISTTSNSRTPPSNQANPITSPTFTLSLSTLSDTVYTLTSSFSLHSILNADLKSQIHSASLTSRWNGLPGGGVNGNPKGNVSDRIMMARFVSFVDSRIDLLKECGGRLEELVAMIDGFGRREARD